MADDLISIGTEIASLNTKMDVVQSDVRILKQQVMEGNGHDSILTRLKLIETAIAEAKGFRRWAAPVGISLLSLLIAGVALLK